MKRLCFASLFLTLVWPMIVNADDVIPSVSKEEMSAYKNAFGKAISDSRRAESNRPESLAAGGTQMNGGSGKGDNFGRKVSDAARNLKADISKDNKNFGAWVSKQRSQRPDDSGASSKGGSDAAKASTTSGSSGKDGKKGHGKNH
jgi:hypothetical protein